MKTAIIIIATIAAGLILSTGCSTIDEKDRYIEVEAATPKRAVLLEEFTGQYCTNCPEGHAFAARLREQYGSSFIPVSIHGGTLAINAGEIEGMTGLAVPDGQTYFQNAGRPNLPAGIVDRVTAAIGRDEWAKIVHDELEKEAPAAIEVKASLEADGKIAIDVEVKPTADFNGNMLVWLTESKIKALQVDDGEYVPDYVHNHVFRATANGIDGDPVSAKKNIFIDKSYSVTPDATWVPANMTAVVFIYNSEGVLQAAEAAVETAAAE